MGITRTYNDINYYTAILSRCHGSRLSQGIFFALIYGTLVGKVDRLTNLVV